MTGFANQRQQTDCLEILALLQRYRQCLALVHAESVDLALLLRPNAHSESPPSVVDVPEAKPQKVEDHLSQSPTTSLTSFDNLSDPCDFSDLWSFEGTPSQDHRSSLPSQCAGEESDLEQVVEENKVEDRSLQCGLFLRGTSEALPRIEEGSEDGETSMSCPPTTQRGLTFASDNSDAEMQHLWASVHELEHGAPSAASHDIHTTWPH
mmetsp:Transcript_90211/g.162683  ORF Transcript_90211/g.162683 Transcript_90211/m.162683 type:complete len:208 (-) Transcript_90211:74-697(-)